MRGERARKANFSTEGRDGEKTQKTRQSDGVVAGRDHFANPIVDAGGTATVTG